MNELSILATLAGVHFMALLSPGPDVALSFTHCLASQG